MLLRPLMLSAIADTPPGTPAADDFPEINRRAKEIAAEREAARAKELDEPEMSVWGF